MDEQLTATFEKSGQTPIEVIIARTGAGVRLTVKTLPEIEAFMKDLGGGRRVDAASYGRAWKPLKAGEILEVYELTERVVIPSDGITPYRIDYVGYPIEHEGYVNLGFLRLVGSSEGIGASFYLKGVYSTPGLRQMKEKIAAASKAFFVDYLRPVNMTIKVSTQEFRA